MTTNPPWQVHRDRLTDAQRRRLELLLAVTTLCPTASTGFTHKQAVQWLATGQWEKQ